MGPRRSVNSFLTAPSRNILTYLLTYLLNVIVGLGGRPRGIITLKSIVAGWLWI